MNLSHRDELLLQRWLDGELLPPDAEAFAARVAAEPRLRQRAAAVRSLRQTLVAARGTPMQPSRAFVGNVLAAIRRLPSRELLLQADVAAGAVAWCRRILVAAALLAALGLLWHTGLFGGDRPAVLQASPDEVQREMQRLDAAILTGELQRK